MAVGQAPPGGFVLRGGCGQSRPTHRGRPTLWPPPGSEGYRATPRMPNSLKANSSRGLALDGFQILDGGRPPHIEQVFANAAVAGATALATDEMGELVFHGDAFA